MSFGGQFARAWIWYIVIMLLAAGRISLGQEADATAATPAPTLHVYVNLIQVAALVLRSPSDAEKTARKRKKRGSSEAEFGVTEARVIRDLPESSFSLRIAGGPRFRPTHVRVEGDDPISLAIMIDVASGPQDDLLRQIDGAIASLAVSSLRPHDRLSFYAVNCASKRAEAQNPMQAAEIREVVHKLLADAQRERDTDCKTTPHLWDAVEAATNDLSESPGRRVILAVTYGADGGSLKHLSQAIAHAQYRGVAIFGLNEGYTKLLTDKDKRYKEALAEDKLGSLCGSNGGVVLTTQPEDLGQRMQQFMEMVRERYIIEFPRAMNATEGLHRMFVSIGDMRPMPEIRFAGGPYKLPDEKEQQDQLVVPESETPQPEQGSRRILPVPPVP